MNESLENSCWLYQAGEWTNIPTRVEWPEGMGWKEWLKSGGFYTSGDRLTGDSEIDGSTVYVRMDGLPGPRGWLFDLTISGHTNQVYVDTLPDYLRFIREEVAPLGMVSEIRELSDMAKKLFRAYHGHDFWDYCRYFDPDEFRRRQEMQRRASEKNRARKTDGFNLAKIFTPPPIGEEKPAV